MRLPESIKNTDAKVSKAAGGLDNRTTIGTDISQRAIKMVQLAGRSLNQIQLEKYVITRLPKNVAKGNKVRDYDQLVTHLQHSYTQLRTSCRNFAAASPQSLAAAEHAFCSSKEADLDLEEFAGDETIQVSTLEEVNCGHQIIGKSTSSDGEQILLVATKKDDIEPRIELFESAGMMLSALDLDLFAQSNAFTLWISQHAPELSDKKVAVFGICATQMYAVVMQSGHVLYKQETPVSTEQLNQLTQRTYQVTEEKADRMMESSNRPSDHQTQVADRFDVQATQEIQRAMQFYYTTQFSDNSSNIKYILLTGTTTQQAGLAKSIFSQTNTPTRYVHLTACAAGSNTVNLPRLQIDAPSLALAFGLTLRGLWVIEFTKIDLLPYREETKRCKKQQFNILMLPVLLAGVGLSVLVYVSISSAIGNRENRNQFLETEVSKLDIDLGEIKELQQEKKDFLAKERKVKELQEKRSQATYIIDTLNVLTPENTYLTAVSAENPITCTITERAVGNNRIAILVRALPSTGVFSQPELLSIKKNDNYQGFTLRVLLNQLTPSISVTETDPQSQKQ